MTRIVLPFHLRNLAKITGEVQLDLPSPVSIDAILTGLEQQYPALKGTIRDHVTRKRRPMIRFFANEQDLSHDPTDSPLPEEIATGKKPFLIIGAIAGG
jgi:hypothetical protein